MKTAIRSSTPLDEGAFRHEALFYSGTDEFVARASALIRESAEAEEPFLVVVSSAKIDLLRSELKGHGGEVRFADMAEVGRNPARIIPAWQEFVAHHAGSGHRFRGIGGRSRDELVECERHEALLNLAFAGTPAWWLVCPYDLESLDAAVLEEAQRNHPSLLEVTGAKPSSLYRGLEHIGRPFDEPLPEPPGPTADLPLGSHRLDEVRTFVGRHATGYGLAESRAYDLVFSVNELATNTKRHANGTGAVRMWADGNTVVCEVSDEGRISDPLIGRVRPELDQEGGFGLWLVTHLCDLVQVRTFPHGSVVRLHLSRG